MRQREGDRVWRVIVGTATYAASWWGAVGAVWGFFSSVEAEQETTAMFGATILVPFVLPPVLVFVHVLWTAGTRVLLGRNRRWLDATLIVGIGVNVGIILLGRAGSPFAWTTHALILTAALPACSLWWATASPVQLDSAMSDARQL